MPPSRRRAAILEIGIHDLLGVPPPATAIRSALLSSFKVAGEAGRQTRHALYACACASRSPLLELLDQARRKAR